LRGSYKLVLLEKPQKKGHRFLVTGFSGFGAVGFLATKFMVEKLGLRRIGYIDTPVVPDLTSLEEYGLSLPHEVFSDESGRLIVLLNRVNPMRSHMNSFVKSFIDLVHELEIDEIVLIGGLDNRFREGSEEFRWLATSSSSRVLDAPKFMKGPYIVGPLASILIACELNKIPAIALFPYTEPEHADHRAAAVAVKVVGKILGIEIDTSELISYAEYVEKLEESIKQMYQRVAEGGEERRSMLYM